MANQYTNKVIFGNETLIDLTSDTVTISDVAQGKTFHLPSGEPAIGTASCQGGGITIVDTPDSHGGTIREITAEVFSKETLNVTQDGTYTAPSGTLYDEVVVSTGGSGTDYLEARLNGTLTSYENDNVTTLYAQSFRSYSPLTSLKVHNVTSIGNAAIYECNGLTFLAFPKLAGTTTPGAMQNNANLEALDLGPDGAWTMPAVSGNSKLNVLVLRRTTGIVSLGGINAFNNTPFASGKAGGTLYVPNALISTYQGATNWSTILGYANNSIQKIEGSYYETHYADGTVIS